MSYSDRMNNSAGANNDYFRDIDGLDGEKDLELENENENYNDNGNDTQENVEYSLGRNNNSCFEQLVFDKMLKAAQNYEKGINDSYVRKTYSVNDLSRFEKDMYQNEELNDMDNSSSQNQDMKKNDLKSSNSYELNNSQNKNNNLNEYSKHEGDNDLDDENREDINGNSGENYDGTASKKLDTETENISIEQRRWRTTGGSERSRKLPSFLEDESEQIENIKKNKEYEEQEEIYGDDDERYYDDNRKSNEKYSEELTNKKNGDKKNTKSISSNKNSTSNKKDKEGKSNKKYGDSDKKSNKKDANTQSNKKTNKNDTNKKNSDKGNLTKSSEYSKVPDNKVESAKKSIGNLTNSSKKNTKNINKNNNDSTNKKSSKKNSNKKNDLQISQNSHRSHKSNNSKSQNSHSNNYCLSTLEELNMNDDELKYEIVNEIRKNFGDDVDKLFAQIDLESSYGLIESILQNIKINKLKNENKEEVNKSQGNNNNQINEGNNNNNNENENENVNNKENINNNNDNNNDNNNNENDINNENIVAKNKEILEKYNKEIEFMLAYYKQERQRRNVYINDNNIINNNMNEQSTTNINNFKIIQRLQELQSQKLDEEIERKRKINEMNNPNEQFKFCIGNYTNALFLQNEKNNEELNYQNEEQQYEEEEKEKLNFQVEKYYNDQLAILNEILKRKKRENEIQYKNNLMMIDRLKNDRGGKFKKQLDDLLDRFDREEAKQNGQYGFTYGNYV